MARNGGVIQNQHPKASQSGRPPKSERKYLLTDLTLSKEIDQKRSGNR